MGTTKVFTKSRRMALHRMNQVKPQHAPTALDLLPKIELHRHLEGALRLDTLANIAERYDLPVPREPEALRKLVQMVEPDGDYLIFLSKFGVIRQFFCAPEVITRFAYEAIADAAMDNIRYIELRFTPRALSVVKGYTMEEATDWVIAATRQAASDYDIEVGLIVSVNRHESVALAEAATRVALDRRDQGILALDLAGNEADYSAEPFVPLFREAAQGGLQVIAHAGEWNGPAVVRHAIEALQVKRIGHGVRALEDPSVVALAREREMCFEVCITTNVHSAAVPSLAQHPLPAMHTAGLICTLNTDDPGISNITLSDEYRLAANAMRLPHDVLKKMTMNAAENALLPPPRREQLIARYQQWLYPENASPDN